MVGAMMLYGILGFNLYTIQIKKNVYYAARAASQFKAGGFLHARRGNIYFTDKNNNEIPIAINKEYQEIFAIPKEIENVPQTTRLVANALELGISDVEILLRDPEDTYEIIVQKASTEQVGRLKQLGDTKGIYVQKREYRFYPFESLGAKVLGFVGLSNKDDEIRGRYGIEKEYEEHLQGINGYFIEEDNEIIEPIHGKDIHLTIDRNIQARVEEILDKLIQKEDAESGVIIIQEPATGKIIAMAGGPGFNPNDYAQSEIKTFLNDATQSIYEPGSVFKPFTVAIGLDAGSITPETTFHDTGSMKLNGETIRNWDLKAHGTVTISEIIENSINTGAALVEQKIGHSTFKKYLKKFDIERPTEIELPNEITGSIANLDDVRDINYATAAFGQGVAVTPLRLIAMISTIANDGVLMKPYLTSTGSPHKVREVISAKAANEVTTMMVTAVKKAVVAYIPGYRIAGKTGTAQVPDFKLGGYTNEFIHTYAGFGPASNPKFTILIKLDKPQQHVLAGQTVVPAFKELAKFILNYYNIPPDDL